MAASSKLKRKHKQTKGESSSLVGGNKDDGSVDLNESDMDSNSETNHSGEVSAPTANSVRKKARTNSSVDDHHHHHHSNHHRLADHNEASSDLDQHVTPASSKKQPKTTKGAAAAAAAASKEQGNNKKEKKIILSEKIFNECKSILRPVCFWNN